MLAVCLACLGCGPAAALWLRVEAPLRVPEECDALEVTAVREVDGKTAFTKSFNLSKGPAFPLTLTLEEPSPTRASETLNVNVRALKAGQLATPWSEATQTVTLQKARLVELRVALKAP